MRKIKRNSALNNQVGGNHYKNMAFQPVELFAKTHCTAFQANIWKYISRYKDKNGKEDIKKCIHYAQLAKELNSKGLLKAEEIKIIWDFCLINNSLSLRAIKIIMAAGFDKYDDVIANCKYILGNKWL